MTQKKSQITAFIIIGLIILISISLLYFVLTYNNRNSIISKSFDIPLETHPIKNFVETCLSDVINDAILYSSMRGGYYEVSNGIEQQFIKIPYYFYNGDKKIPTKSQIEEEISKYIYFEIDKCLDNFSSFKKIGYKIEKEDKIIKTNLGKNIDVRLEYPIKLTKEDTTTKISNFYYNKNFNFDKLYEFILDFSNEHQKNPNFVPIGYLSFLAQKNNIIYNLIYTKKDEVIYSFIFNNLFDSNKTLLFNLAVKYNWSNRNRQEDIQINSIEPQYAYVDYEFEYQVSANESNIKFVDFSYLFEIDEKTGLIKFTPTKKDVGIHNIIIKAYDDKGLETSTIMQLDIVKENFAPIIERIDDVKLKVGDTFNTTIKAIDFDEDLVMFLVESALTELKINTITGQLNFTPKKGDEGLYTITIIAIDTNSDISKTSFRMEIINEE
jgi:hypothetical protein